MAGGDDRSLRAAALDELRRVIPFEAYAWLLTDPESSVGCSPLAEAPCLDELPALIRLKYLTAVNRWTSLPAGQARRLWDATGGDLSRSLVWRELLSRYAVSDMLSVRLADQHGCWGFLDLWRIGSGQFSDMEEHFLSSVSGHLANLLRSVQARTFTHPNGVAAALIDGPVVLVLAPTVQVRGQTEQTDAHLRMLVPAESGRAPVPASAYNVAAQLLAIEGGVDDNPAFARVHLTGGRWMTLRAARIDGPGPMAERDIAVTVQGSTSRERLGVFTRACGLTPRETQLVGHLAKGCDTRDLARLMSLSEHTVQDHLKAIFGKTGSRSRGDLLSRGLGA